MFKKQNKVKNKIFSILVVALVFSLAFGGIVTAAGGVEAFFPTYDTYINGQKIDNSDILVRNGQTHLNISKLESYGVLKNWNEQTRTANFFIPNPLPNNGNSNSISDLAKSGVRFYKGNGTFLGNGIFLNKDLVIVPKQVYKPTLILKSLDYKNTEINFEPQVIAQNSRLVLLKTKGYQSDYFAKLATTKPEAGEDIILVGSIQQQPNFYNFSTVKDEFDFNWLTTGDKAYLRSYNNCDSSAIGAGMYTKDGLLGGIFVVKGANYAISITLNDINSFVPNSMLP